MSSSIKHYTKLILIFFITIVIATGVYIFLSKTELVTGAKELLNNEQKETIKKYVFPYRFIRIQENRISSLSEQIPNLELIKKDLGTDILLKQSVYELPNKKLMKKYLLTSGFYNGIDNIFPGSGYFDFHDENMFIVSARGVLAYGENTINNDTTFIQIKNNINEFINIDQFKKKNWFSIKDLTISNSKVYISYTEEIQDDCWNTSIVFADIDYKMMEFKKLFSSNDCIHSIKNTDNVFNALQSGGRIISYDDEHILFSIGDYRSRDLPQNKKSVNGKIIKININNYKYEIFSMGHRNPQGLFFDRENNFILETEHGPMGGDEINILETEIKQRKELPNYGWPISSAGEHYGLRHGENKKVPEKYPLHKSHKDYGFIEPLKSFVPSPGLSEIVKIGKNKYALGSMKFKSLYIFELNDQREMIDLQELQLKERIRDLKFKNDNLYLFLEDSASIGIINFK